jgi:DNA-binding NarL/FixJ family response regulator
MSSSQTPITIAIVDDHDSVRLGVKAGAQEAGYVVLDHADSVEALLAKLQEPPMVVVLDLSLADGSTPASNVKALVEYGTKVLIYSIADNKDKVNEALREGAEGLVAKGQDMSYLFEAIRLPSTQLKQWQLSTMTFLSEQIFLKENYKL